MIKVEERNGKLTVINNGSVVNFKSTKIMSANGIYVMTNRGQGKLHACGDKVYIIDECGNLIELG